MTDRSLPAHSPDPYGPQHRPGGGVPTEYHAAPSMGQAGGWNDPEEESLDWRRYVAALIRHKWMILLGLGLGAVVGALAYQSVDPEYQVQSTVWIEPEGGGAPGDAAPIRPSHLLNASGWVALMRSFAVLDPVVQDLRLYVSPADPGHGEAFEGFHVSDAVQAGAYELRQSDGGGEWVLATAAGVEVERGGPGSTFGESVGFQWTPPANLLGNDEAVAFSVQRPRAVAASLAEQLDVSLDGQGTFLRVAMTGTNPTHITRVVNGVTDRYIEVAEELKRAKFDELTSILEEQLAFADSALQGAEFALQRFRVETISLPSEQSSPVAPGLQQTQNPVFQNFFNLKLEQEEARRDEIAIQRALSIAGEQGRLATEALEVIPSVRESSDLMNALGLATEKRAELRALRLRYTDQHPDVRDLEQEVRELEEQTIPALAGSLLNEVRGRQGEIDRFVGQAAQELQQIPPRAVEENRRQREFASAENLFRDLQGRYESARLGAASTVPDVRILDRAQVPTIPTSDPRVRFLAMAMMAGLGLGLLGALLRDRIDPLLRRPDQVTRGLGLPILGTIPHARMRRKRLNEEDQEQVVEAFRNLRLAVSYSHGPSEPLVLTVTSPGIGDGKSFTTSNLALAFAELGRSTLVIDGDIRRGTVHTLFQQERRPGLTDYLSGDARLDEVLRTTEHPALQVIPSGSRFRDAPELIGLPSMQALLQEVRARFDVILIDSSPLGAAVDPYLLGTLSGSMLVVLRNGITDRELAETRLGDLTRLPIQLLGAVLNDVPTGTGPYRYYSYLPGYGTGDEGTSSNGRQRPPALAGSTG
ncbi:MAG: polysaccharide biosynthesis tyrosine autokinase [Gemmatimonadota bacterium]